MCCLFPSKAIPNFHTLSRLVRLSLVTPAPPANHDKLVPHSHSLSRYLSSSNPPQYLYPSLYQRKMQLRHSICALLLFTLSQTAFATLEYSADARRMTSSSITKRADAVQEAFLLGSLVESQPLAKRQSVCPISGYSLCSNGVVCCKFFSLSL